VIALDTNLLIYAHRPTAAENGRARAAIQEASQSERGWGFAVACAAEFFSVVTQVTLAGSTSTASLAAEFLRELTRAGAQVWVPGHGFHERMFALAERVGTTGRRIYDLQIGLTAREGGATEIWTNDRGFLAVPGLKVVNPF
jgi:hypothetical protein